MEHNRQKQQQITANHRIRYILKMHKNPGTASLHTAAPTWHRSRFRSMSVYNKKKMPHIF